MHLEAAQKNTIELVVESESSLLCEACKKYSGCVIHKRFGNEIVKCDEMEPINK